MVDGFGFVGGRLQKKGDLGSLDGKTDCFRNGKVVDSTWFTIEEKKKEGMVDRVPSRSIYRQQAFFSQIRALNRR